ncbi:MAG: iron-containing alcohol dehydrogenase [Clostridia bacterium]|nr:iron-containing alcohol dehydrogenase [Clostridia bacterium]
MDNFTLFNPTKILFGKGQLECMQQEIPAGAKVLILYGGGSVKRTGLLDRVKIALTSFDTVEFGGIEPNPEYETLMKAATLVRAEKFNFLLAVGGGSVIDGTKFIAAAAPFKGADPWMIPSQRAPISEAIPFGTVLTLPATGSEMNCGAVITRRSACMKLGFSSTLLYPRFSVLDPEFTFTLPERQTGNGIVDTFVHVTEQYLTYPDDALIQDRWAEGLLLTLIQEGPKALKSPQDYHARANLMWASTLALNGYIGAGVPLDGASHKIGHAITALYGIDHARTLAPVLPALLTVMKDEKRAKLLQYARRVWCLDCADEDAAIDEGILRTSAFFESVGVPVHLSAYHLGTEVVGRVLENLTRTGMTAIGENGTITPDKIEKILNIAL